MNGFRTLIQSERNRPKPASKEALRTALRSAIGYLEARRCLARLQDALDPLPGRSVAVTSLSPGEGKSTTCLLLAGAAAAQGLKPLIIDATTFVRPGGISLEEVLGVEDSPGDDVSSSPALPGIDYRPWIIREGTRVEEGRHELERMSRGYDLVFIDTVSLTSWNRSNVDPFLCCRIATGAAIVVSGSPAQAPEAGPSILTDLTRSGVRLLGAIGNGGLK